MKYEANGKTFSVTLDELVTEGHISMRKATYEALTGETLEQPGILNRKTGDLSARISRFSAATAAVTVQPEATEPGPDEAPCEDAEEAPIAPAETQEHEWLRKEAEAKEQPLT